MNNDKKPRPPELTRLTLSPTEAAAVLGVSRDYFDQHVRPGLRVIREGRLVLVPVRELEQWVHQNATRTLDLYLVVG